MVQLESQKMGIHEWSYDNAISPDERYAVPWSEAARKLDSISTEVELGFDAATAWKETQRCLNCDVQTVFTRDKCIERSEEHTSELQSLMRISYAVFCLNKKNHIND